MSKKIKTISILGAGWLGLPLGERLAKDGYFVKGSTTRAERLFEIADKGLHAYQIRVGTNIQGDLVEDFFITDLIIVNIPPGRRNPQVHHFYPKQIQAILQSIQKNNIRYCLFISSTSVYGNQNGEVDEGSPLQPDTRAGQALIESEQLFRQAKGLHTTVLRLGGLAGKNRQLGRFLAGRKNLKNGDAPVNLVHLDDCIEAVVAIIQNNCWDQTFNVVADKHPSRRELYTQQAIQLQLEPPTFAPNSELEFKIVSSKKLKQMLGFEFSKPDPQQF